MPAAGEEVDDEVAVLRPLSAPLPPDRTSSEDHDLGSGISRQYVEHLPLFESIDLSNVPAGYKQTTSSTVDSFEFMPGELYDVTLVSDVTLKRTIVAE